MHYAPNSARPHPFTAILRANSLSIRSKQLRFRVLGTKGSFLKSGIDIQEAQLKVMPTVDGIFSADYGREPEKQWGTVTNVGPDGVSISESMCVPLVSVILL